MKILLTVCVAVICTLFSSASCIGGLTITFTEISPDLNGDTIQISWQGGGIVGSTAGVGSTLNFDDFGSILTLGGNSDDSYRVLGGTLNLTNVSTSNTLSYSEIRIDKDSGDNDDITLQPPPSFNFSQDDEYSASGSGTLQGLSFSDVDLTSTVLTSDSGDSDVFGTFNDGSGGSGVTLRFVSLTNVPEPTSLTLFSIVVGPVLLTRKRKRSSFA